jgi:glutathione S-transferase
MDLSLRAEREVSELTHQDLRRLVELWSGLLARFGGPWLLGAGWSIADAFYTPVATRLRSYGLRLSDWGDAGPCAAYAGRLLATPEFLQWEKDALADARP